MVNNPPPQDLTNIPDRSPNFAFGYPTIIEPIGTFTEGAWVKPEDTGPTGDDHAMREPSGLDTDVDDSSSGQSILSNEAYTQQNK
jgi:hypothetical protein